MKRVLITGGAGFVGTNLADRFARQGIKVRIFDNLSRAGVERNLRWLQNTHGELIEPVIGDTRDAVQVRGAVEDVDAVFHFAAQVAVTTSLVDPTTDFAVNALGTLNVLEALRARGEHVPLVFTSTNKVYGGLEDVALIREGERYRPKARALHARGINEDRPLDFHSPYGCSKGAADQYVLDYGRSFGMPTCVFRMSCIYGPHQFGTEDQGWVAHFLIRAIRGEPITLYGDGKQVRDVLFVEDLVDAFTSALARMDAVKGMAFNIGGGPTRTTSLLELLERIQALHGTRPDVRFEPWRTGDQRYYVSDTARFSELTGWQQNTDLTCGLERLYAWLLEAEGQRPSSPLIAEAGASS